MAEFEKGETVKLKSGGPKMTVVDTGDSMTGKDRVWTVWFDGAKKMDGDFPTEAVEKVSERSARGSVHII
jgi:uncharacterized protein YodC (DUF2158 family)